MNTPAHAVQVMLPTAHQQTFAVVCALLLLAVVIALVRRRIIREEYALLWLATSVAILVVSASKTVMLALIKLTGAGLATSVMILCAILFMMLLLIHLTAVISRQRRMICDLAIRHALLAEEVERLREQGEDAEGRRPSAQHGA